MNWVWIAEGKKPFFSRKTNSGQGNTCSTAYSICLVYMTPFFVCEWLPEKFEHTGMII